MTLEEAERMTAAYRAAYEAARYDYAVAVLGEVGCRIRAVYPAAAAVKAGAAALEDMMLVAVLDSSGKVLARRRGDDDGERGAFARLAADVDDSLRMVASLGLKPGRDGLLAVTTAVGKDLMRLMHYVDGVEVDVDVEDGPSVTAFVVRHLGDGTYELQPRVPDDHGEIEIENFYAVEADVDNPGGLPVITGQAGDTEPDEEE